MRNAYKMMFGKYEGKVQLDNLKDLAIDGKIILKWVLDKWGLRLSTGFK
jgi:hypothetical protein